jgi:hypothetical protein
MFSFKPDISLVTKSGHFHLLITMPQPLYENHARMRPTSLALWGCTRQPKDQAAEGGDKTDDDLPTTRHETTGPVNRYELKGCFQLDQPLVPFGTTNSGETMWINLSLAAFLYPDRSH